MGLNPVVLSIPIFFVLIGAEIIYDRVKNRHLYRLNDAITNVSCGIVEQISGLFAKVFTVAAYYFVYKHFALFHLPNAWYWWLLCFVGVDFFYYWAHRMSHEVNLFWLGHVVHHQSEEYNLSVALRQSSLQKIFTFYFYFPLAILGFHPGWFVLAGAYNLLYQFWIHTEVVGKLGWFEYIFNTPSHHRVHHGRNPKYIDKNHAGTLIIWDRMFGTFQEEEEAPAYGITKPVQTWDPVRANVKPFQDLWQQMKKVHGLKNKLKLAFMPPGWYPEELGGPQKPPEISRQTATKFDVPIPSALNIYLFIQYLLVLGGTATFLFSVGHLSWLWRVLISVYLIYSVMSLGLLFERNKHSVKSEFLRFFIGMALLFPLSWEHMFPVALAVIFVTIGIASVIYLYKQRSNLFARVAVPR